MTIAVFVYGLAFVLVVLLVACVLNADEVERHDDRVRMRWTEARES